MIARKNMRKRRSEAGISLLETIVALGILLVISVGILTMAMISMTTTENQGHLAARTTEYAQDKMEQLLGLAFTDGSLTSGTDTTAIDTTNNTYTLGTGGTGLVAGGSLSTTAPTNGYVDYLDANGNPLGGGSTKPTNAFYIRVWQITDTTSSLKTISVKVAAVTGVNTKNSAPNSTVTALKSSPF
jgi:type II secretory pathway pseudopilin PulG